MSNQSNARDDAPLYSERRKRLIRRIVVITVIAMMLPLVASLISVTNAVASQTCSLAVQQVDPTATGSNARFQVFGPGFIGWECYSTGSFGGGHHIISLGLFPGLAKLPG